MGSKGLRIVFAGGGTGGHLFPGLAIADEIKRLRPDADITFVGTSKKIESRIVPRRGYAFRTIWISGFRRSLSPDNLLFPLKVVVALVQSFMLIRQLRPSVVVGTGGYVCGPVVSAATLLGVPTLLQEQNSYPGITTRLLAIRVNEVHITFDSTRRYLRRTDNVRLSGNPTREILGQVSRDDAIAHFGLDRSKKTLLVFGGSLGASSINRAVEAIFPELTSLNVQLLWQTGEADFERLKTTAPVHKFIDRMEYAYAACDLALCRAGATTLAELTRCGVPSILVPYPFAAADHQTENARSMVAAGAAVMIRDDKLTGELLTNIRGLMGDDDRRRTMGRNARALGRPEASRTLADAVLSLGRG